MGTVQPGKKINRKTMIRYANEEHRIATRNLRALENAIIANANMQQILQHQMCVCTHGATKHWNNPERLCEQDGCACTGWISLWTQAFEAWTEAVKDEVHKLDDPSAAAILLEDGLLERWFDASVKPDQAALRVKERLELELKATEVSEEANERGLP